MFKEFVVCVLLTGIAFIPVTLSICAVQGKFNALLSALHSLI